MKNCHKRQKYVDVSFLLKNKEVIGKRFHFKEKYSIPDVIFQAKESLNLNPLEIKSVAVEFIEVDRSIMYLSSNFVKRIIDRGITQAVQNLMEVS